MWIHHWDPESKLESMQWKHLDFLHLKKCRTQTSTSKGIVTIFWDSEGLLLIDCLPPEKTITGQYYAELTCKVHDANKWKRHGKLSLGVWLLQKQYASSQITCCTASCSLLWICSTKPLYVQSRPCFQWLLSVKKSKISSSWKPVCKRRIA